MIHFASYAALWLVLLAPLLGWRWVAHMRGGGLEDAPGFGRRYANAVVAGALAVATLAFARHLLTARPLVEGVDFYYYLCVARDLADGVGTSETRHFSQGKAKRTGKRSPPHNVLARLLSIKYPHLGLTADEMKKLAAQAAKIALKQTR